MQALENVPRHVSPHILVPKKMYFVVFDTLRARLGDIVQQCAPPRR